MKLYKIPTGYLFVDSYSRGQLETLSIGDYGKAKNVKADFLGYTDEINGVPNGHCMPLSEKWVVTLSTQYGCPMKCTFCDVPKLTYRGNTTFEDLQQQLYSAVKLWPDVKYTDRLNIHFARMGEPIFNPEVFNFSEWLYKNKHTLLKDLGLRIEVVHPVLTTSLPRHFVRLQERLLWWCHIKNNVYNGQAGLQFSINSTNETQRSEMFDNKQLELSKFAFEIANTLPNPLGRKYCLNFAYSTDFEVDATKLLHWFSPERFMIKITPIHNNNACQANNIKTLNGYDSFEPYRQVEANLKQVGFDVLVFVPSMDEEDGCVTCGNAILGGSTLKVSNK